MQEAVVLSKIKKLNEFQIERSFPNLKHKENFEYTSNQTDDYNCVAWANEKDDDFITIPYYNSNDCFNDMLEGYINYFISFGFERTEYFEKDNKYTIIALYTKDENQFMHVARLLENGKWTSKIGNWEDIEHTTLNSLSGGAYGEPTVFMRKLKTISSS